MHVYSKTPFTFVKDVLSGCTVLAVILYLDGQLLDCLLVIVLYMLPDDHEICTYPVDGPV